MGRAIQDVWIILRRELRTPTAPSLPVAGNWYGTTLRVFDPTLDRESSRGQAGQWPLLVEVFAKRA